MVIAAATFVDVAISAPENHHICNRKGQCPIYAPPPGSVSADGTTLHLDSGHRMTTTTADAPALAIASRTGRSGRPGAGGALKRRWPFWLGVAVTLLMIGGLGARAVRTAAWRGWRSDSRQPAVLRRLPRRLYVAAAGRLDHLPQIVAHARFAGWCALIKKPSRTMSCSAIRVRPISTPGRGSTPRWSRRRSARSRTSSILSAIAGNAITLVLLVLAVPFAGQLLRCRNGCAM